MRVVLVLRYLVKKVSFSLCYRRVSLSMLCCLVMGGGCQGKAKLISPSSPMHYFCAVIPPLNP